MVQVAEYSVATATVLVRGKSAEASTRTASATKIQLPASGKVAKELWEAYIEMPAHNMLD